MQFFQKHIFWAAIAGIALAETFSLFAYHFDSQALQNVGFLAVTAAVLVLSLRNLEYGVLIAFAELFVSSFGHLFKFEAGPINMSLRVGIFAAVQIAYNIMLFTHILRGAAKKRNWRIAPFFIRLHAFFQKGLRDSKILTDFFRGPYFYPNWGIFIAIVIAAIAAIAGGNEPKNILRDADAFVVFAYFPIIWAALADIKGRLRLYNVFTASMTWLFAQTVAVLFVFAHRLSGPMEALYLWIRDARIGEITLIASDFYRIFFQSYVYALIGIFIFTAFFLCKPSENYNLGPKSGKMIWVLFVICAFLLLISFSRSFWFGGLAAVIAVVAVKARAFFTALPKLLLGILAALTFIFAVVNFPLPSKGPPVLLADLFAGRATSLFHDAAAASRWRLLPVLWEEIKETPVLGAGFGKTITYQTTDPRILADDPTGTVTTYAFEWGYLDLWLKFGLIGLLAYGWLLWRILRLGYKELGARPTPIRFGLWIGMIALVAAHFWTPFLNHPLGIGIIIASASVFRSKLD